MEMDTLETIEEDSKIDDVEENEDMKRRSHMICFIQQYEALPVLWDNRRADYLDKVKRHEALLKLLEVYRKIRPEAKTNDVKKKLNILRSNYRKEIRLIESSKRSGASGDDVYRPKCWVFYALQFLNVISSKPRKITRKVKIKNDPLAPSGAPPETHFLSMSYGERPNTPTSGTSFELPKRPPNQWSTSNGFSSNHHHNEGSTYEDDDYLNMAKVWARKLKDIDPLQRFYAEKAINDILFEAQLGILRTRVKKNTHRYSDCVTSRSTSIRSSVNHGRNATSFSEDAQYLQEDEEEEMLEEDIKPIISQLDETDSDII